MNSSTDSKKKDRSDNGKRNQADAKQYFGDLRRKGEVVRHTYHVRAGLLEKIRAYAYWERIGISELINRILEDFFKDKEVKPRPRSPKKWHY